MVSQVFEPSLIPVSDRSISWPRFQPAPARPFSGGARGHDGAGPLRLPQQDQVHVWAAWLEASDSARASYRKILGAEELERAGRFHFEEHRNRYIVAHGWLRRLLGTYLGCSPTELEFGQGAKGKPFLSGRAGSSGLQFNLAHSGVLAMAAVSARNPVGVDIEEVRRLEDAETLVRHFFCPAEINRFKQLPQERKNAAFFNLWTRKEAWLKATGEGIAHLLSQVEVSFVPGEEACLLNLPGAFKGSSEWSLCDLNPAPGYAGALAVAVPRVEVECRRWDHEVIGADL